VDPQLGRLDEENDGKGAPERKRRCRRDRSLVDVVADYEIIYPGDGTWEGQSLIARRHGLFCPAGSAQLEPQLLPAVLTPVRVGVVDGPLRAISLDGRGVPA
jgi:hypothetical protein